MLLKRKDTGFQPYQVGFLGCQGMYIFHMFDNKGIIGKLEKRILIFELVFYIFKFSGEDVGHSLSGFCGCEQVVVVNTKCLLSTTFNPGNCKANCLVGPSKGGLRWRTWI